MDPIYTACSMLQEGIIGGMLKPRIYLKNVNFFGEQKHACLNTIMNGTVFFLSCHSGSHFQTEIYNLDRTNSSFLATNFNKNKYK